MGGYTIVYVSSLVDKYIRLTGSRQVGAGKGADKGGAPRLYIQPSGVL